MSLALGYISVKILLHGISEIFLSMFSSRSFVVSLLIFKSFIHIDFTFEYFKPLIPNTLNTYSNKGPSLNRKVLSLDYHIILRKKSTSKVYTFAPLSDTDDNYLNLCSGYYFISFSWYHFKVETTEAQRIPYLISSTGPGFLTPELQLSFTRPAHTQQGNTPRLMYNNSPLWSLHSHFGCFLFLLFIYSLLSNGLTRGVKWVTASQGYTFYKWTLLG